ncbi:MAG: DUF423 domain-containing protein [Spirochaetia bacterium]|nr:DUF423 domain-containing protein [Spirochaetia bacterium]
MNKNYWIRIGALSGMLTVAMGAFGAHALKNSLDEYSQAIYAKAVLYQIFHTIGIFIVGILIFINKKNSLNIAGVCFTLGILLFSGSLYALAISGIKWLGMITPLGGLSFIVGWLLLFIKTDVQS